MNVGHLSLPAKCSQSQTVPCRSNLNKETRHIMLDISWDIQYVCMPINLCLYRWMGVCIVDDYGCFLFMVWYVVWCDAM